jgi:hypothetical protein
VVYGNMWRVQESQNTNRHYISLSRMRVSSLHDRRQGCCWRRLVAGWWPEGRAEAEAAVERGTARRRLRGIPELVFIGARPTVFSSSAAVFTIETT